MMKLKSTFLTFALIIIGIQSASAQIAAANPQLVNEESAMTYVMGQSISVEELSSANIHFEIRDYDGNQMDEIEILGGAVYVIDGSEAGTLVGSINSNGAFDAVAKSFFIGKENIQLKCVLKAEIDGLDQEMTFNYVFLLK